MTESYLDEAFKAAVDPVSQELARIEELIVAREADLAVLKASRTRGRKLLAVLDPSTEQPKKKKGGAGSRVSDARIETILDNIRKWNGGGTFTARNVQELTGLHQTTCHKALKALHDRGQVRLDHMGGARGTTKVYALVGGDE